MLFSKVSLSEAPKESAFIPKAHAEAVQKPVTPKGNYPDADAVSRSTGQAVYKILRLQEMASLWQGTSLEPDTVRLLAMLLQEDGSLTAERRHDCINGVCYAMGIMGHHICHRGTPLVYDWGDDYPMKKFCSWKDGKSPQKQFEEAYPGFATEWRVQFAEYTLRQTHCRDAKKSVTQCIMAWNPGEGPPRLTKVKSREPLVRAALGI